MGVNDSMIFTEELFECKQVTAAVYSTSPGEFLISGMSYEQCLNILAVKLLCTFKSDLNKVPRHLFIKKKGVNSLSYYEINYKLVMTLQSAQLVFHMEFQGKEYGSERANYLYD